MALVFAELPLALFTTLGSLAAGTFIMLAVLVSMVKLDDERLKRIDRLSAVPLLVLCVAFVCAFFHLKNPVNALGVFAGVGASPLSNELLSAVIFAVVAIVYWALAVSGKLSFSARRVLSAALAVMGFVFAVFMGLAYMMGTIPSWDTIATPVQMVGFSLLGGATLSLLLLEVAGAQEGEAAQFQRVALIVAAVGAIAAIAGVAGTYVVSSGLENRLVSVVELTQVALPLLVAAVVCLALAVVLCVVGLKQAKNRLMLFALAVVFAVVGTFLARLVFYALEISIGLCA